MNRGCFILCTLDNSLLTGHYGCTGQVALEMHFHCHIINTNISYETLVDGRHLVVTKGYSDDVYSNPSCLALISTMFYFAISQHRQIQIPARNWKWHHPPPTPPPKPDSTDTNPPSMNTPSPMAGTGRGLQDIGIFLHYILSKRLQAGIFRKVSPMDPKSPVPLAGGSQNSRFDMWTGVFLISRLKIAGCRKVMPSGAPTPQELMEVCNSHTELNPSCHSTGRNCYKPFPFCVSHFSELGCSKPS